MIHILLTSFDEMYDVYEFALLLCFVFFPCNICLVNIILLKLEL